MHTVRYIYILKESSAIPGAAHKNVLFFPESKKKKARETGKTLLIMNRILPGHLGKKLNYAYF